MIGRADERAGMGQCPALLIAQQPGACERRRAIRDPSGNE
jgi:hypothetical protein